MLIRVIILLTVYKFVSPTVPDFYWRDYDGNVPSDAFVADNETSSSTYIGNVPIWGGGLYIGQLKSGTNEINVTGYSETSDGPVHTRYSNIEIFCTRSPELFTWITIDDALINKLDNTIPGGYEGTNLDVLLIGRVYYNNRYVIGKVSDYYSDTYNGRIFIPDDSGKNEISFYTYEILYYLGKMKEENVTP